MDGAYLDRGGRSPIPRGLVSGPEILKTEVRRQDGAGASG